MKTLKLCERAISFGNRLSPRGVSWNCAVAVLLLTIAFLGTSAQAATFTWDGARNRESGATIQIDGSGLIVSENMGGHRGGSLALEGGSLAFEKLSGDTSSGTITFDVDPRKGDSSLTLSLCGIKRDSHSMTFDGTGRITVSSSINFAGSPLAYDRTTTAKSGALSITSNGANAANAAEDAEGAADHSPFAARVGVTSVSSFSSLLIDGSFGSTVTVQSSSLGQATLRNFRNNQAVVLPEGGTFDFSGGILAKNLSENTIGALSLAANSTFDLHEGGRAVSLRVASASTTEGTEGNTFITGPISSDNLSPMEFTSDALAFTRLGGVIRPVPEPINVALGVFGAVFVVFGIGRRLCARRSRVVES